VNKGQHVEAPVELSRVAQSRWQEQADALFEAGRLTVPRLALLMAWATAIDARDRAAAQWEEHGSPLEQSGRSGQPRPHHLKVSLERAEAQLVSLTAKLERSAARREQRRSDGLPVGARRVEVDGTERVVGEDGRVLRQSLADGRWMLDSDEVDYDAGAKIRWLGEDGAPRFHEVPPWRMPGDGGRPSPLPWPECEDWEGRVGVPVQALREWYQRPERAPSQITYASRVSLDHMLSGV